MDASAPLDRAPRRARAIRTARAERWFPEHSLYLALGGDPLLHESSRLSALSVSGGFERERAGSHWSLRLGADFDDSLLRYALGGFRRSLHRALRTSIGLDPPVSARRNRHGGPPHAWAVAQVRLEQQLGRRTRRLVIHHRVGLEWLAHLRFSARTWGWAVYDSSPKRARTSIRLRWVLRPDRTSCDSRRRCTSAWDS